MDTTDQNCLEEQSTQHCKNDWIECWGIYASWVFDEVSATAMVLCHGWEGSQGLTCVDYSARRATDE